MEKPKVKVQIPEQSGLDYSDMIDYIENKYNIRTRDYGNRYTYDEVEGHFDKYQRITGDKMPFGNNIYPDISGGYKNQWTSIRDGKRVPVSKEEYDADLKLIHEHYQRYKDWSKTNPEPPYLDFWHWLLNNVWEGAQQLNGTIQCLNINEVRTYNEVPEWVDEILTMIETEFGDQADKFGELELYLFW